MPKINDVLKTGTTLGVALGIGATILAAALIPTIPVIVRAARPTARAAIKSGLVLLERSREVVSEFNEEFEDMMAEVRAELQMERNDTDTDIDNNDDVIAAAPKQEL